MERAWTGNDGKDKAQCKWALQVLPKKIFFFFQKFVRAEHFKGRLKLRTEKFGNKTYVRLDHSMKAR